jgi:hypothetical protein
MACSGCAVNRNSILFIILLFTSLHGSASTDHPHTQVIVTDATGCTPQKIKVFFFLDFLIYLQSVETHSANGVLGSEGGLRSAL